MRDDLPLAILDQDDFPLGNQDLLTLLQAVLASGGNFRFRAAGDSMLPFIKHGDFLTLSPVPPGARLVGQVVACVHPTSGSLVIHRVIRYQGAKCLIKGDYSAGGPDGWIAASEIFAVLTGIERAGQPVKLGLGWERWWIALLSRWNVLNPFLVLFWRMRSNLK